MVNKPFTARVPLSQAREPATGSWNFQGRAVRIVISACLVLAGITATHADVLVTVSKSQQRAAIVVDGAELYRWPVSTGRRGHDTPNGMFRPQRLERHWYSRQYEMTPMPWAVFFHRGYAVHGTLEAYNLGHAASHGCVRLRPDNAAILYSLVRRQGMANTRIMVTQAALPSAPQPKPVPKVTPTPGAAVSDAGATAPVVHGEQFLAQAHAVDAIDDEAEAAPPRAVRTVHRLIHRVSAGNAETQVLRERQAWLLGLDRKYGIAH